MEAYNIWLYVTAIMVVVNYNVILGGAVMLYSLNITFRKGLYSQSLKSLFIYLTTIAIAIYMLHGIVVIMVQEGTYDSEIGFVANSAYSIIYAYFLLVARTLIFRTDEILSSMFSGITTMFSFGFNTLVASLKFIIISIPKYIFNLIVKIIKSPFKLVHSVGKFIASIVSSNNVATITKQARPQIKAQVSQQKRPKIATTTNTNSNFKRNSSSNKIPSEAKLHDFVIANNNKLELKQEVGSGHEAVCYLTSSVIVAKIFKPKTLAKLKIKQQKVNYLINLQNKNKSLCFPKNCIYNSNKEFIGYSMLRANGVELKKALIDPNGQDKYLPDWSLRNSIELCRTLAKTITEIHNLKLFVGDVNPSNILIQNSRTVYFIDTDSYQVDNMPCTVGMQEYTRKKHIDKPDYNYLRNSADDSYAIYVISFQILMCGKLPYSHKGGDTVINDIRKGYFPYHPTNPNKCKSIPAGAYTQLWFRLPEDLRKFFFEVFAIKKSNKLSTFIKILEDS